MNQIQFTFIYISLLSLEFLTLYTLIILNIGSVLKNRDKVPDLFKDLITPDMYVKNVAYTIKKEHFSILNMIVSTLITLIILLSGVLGSVEQFFMGFFTNKTILGLSFIAGISVLQFIIDLPLSLYSTFVIEEEFGFNKMTLKSYITDTLKQTVLGIIIGGILLAALFFFMDKTGGNWWLWASIFFISFQLILFLIYPNFIAPIFNKFKPLEDGELKEALETMASSANFALNGIFVMDGSKRSGHSNAYFTGIGKSKRIVLYDTLVEQLTNSELCGVLAHEIGHWKKGHIRKRLLTTMLTVPVAFYILSLALNFDPLFLMFNLETGTYHGMLVLMLMISSSFTFFLTPISSYRSRKHEFEADDFAKEITGESDPLIQALLKLSKDNLSNLTPDKIYSSYHYSHPPVSERVNNLNSSNK
ncbi:MAG: M48 family metallopeptidase [Spirochaetaceae bacterium]